MKQKILGIVLLAQIAFVCQISAEVIINDPIEDDGTWTLGTTVFPYLPAGYGLTPTFGEVMMHFSDYYAESTGTNSIIYSNTIVPGIYIASIDVGHWDNSDEIATVGPTGLTADGTLLMADSASRPSPALGQFETWRFTYRFNSGDPSIGKRVGFQISVPYMEDARNIAFDNLRVDYYFPGAVLPSIYRAVEICWDTESNKTYRVQWATSIDTTNWSDTGPIMQGTGSNMCVFDSTRFQPKRFYRVLPSP